MKEMVGGCCVCSDEHGWTENPLVYCDGQNCTVAVHQACYGIVTVPTGPWYCRKCESQERSARVRCELCPSRDGALKKTDNQGWAHVVCALYIPEVRFGNVTTMEPIILQLIPPERYAKTCYICTEIGKPSRAACGACMQCNKSGCKQQFHVTCAQALGLLCEEAGNYLDNVKYCGYCQHHYSKLVRKKKGGNVKTIPPYKPITHETGSSDPPSSPEKDTANLQTNSSIPSTSSTSSSIKTTIQNVTTSIGSSSSSSSKQRKSSGQSKNINSNITNTTPSLSTPASTSSTSIQNLTAVNSGINSSAAPTNTSTSGSTTTTTTNSNNKTITTIGGKDKDKHTKSMSNKVSSTNKNHDKDTSSSSSSSTRDKSSKSSKNNNSKDSVITESALLATSAHKTADMKLEKTNIIVLTPTTTPTTQSSSSITQLAKPSTTANITATSIIVANTKDTKELMGQKFASSNFSETNTSNTDSVFGNESVKTSSSSTTVAKKRKSETTKNISSPTIEEIHKDLIKDVSVTLVPLQNVGKSESIEPDKLSKKAKIDQTLSGGGGSHQISNDSILQNIVNPIKSPILTQQPTIVLKQILPTNNASTIQQSTSSSASMIKSQQQINENTTRTVPQSSLITTTTSTTAASSSFTTQQMSTGSTPSLVVSVPLSTAGVNIPSISSSSGGSGNNTNTTSSLNNQNLLQQSGQNLFQQLTQNRDSSTATSTVGGTGAHIGHYQQNQLVNQNLVTNMDQQRQTSHHNLQGIVANVPSTIQQQHLSNSLNDHNTTTNLQSNILQSTSPLSSSSTTASATLAHKNMSAIITPINTDNSVLKINYEKQANTRVAQLQEDLPGKRSSRSQSGENTKSRAYKKKGNIIQTTIPTTTATISTPMLPVSSSTSNINLYSDSSTIIGTNLQNNNNNNLIHSNIKNQTNNSTTTTSSTTSSSAVTTGHHPIKKSTRNKTNEIQPSSTSRTPDTNYTTISYGGGLKFTYEAQPHPQQQSSSTMTTTSSSAATPTQQQQLSNAPTQTIVKDSPPSSPGSEAGSRKRGRKSIDTKDIKIFQNGVVATHMLGNQLNPSSSVAQKLTDQLNMEIEAHSIYTASSLESGSQLLGPPFPGKLSNARLSTSQQQPLGNLLSGSSSSSQSGNTHQSLEQLLERQWEQGSQFLMEQAQHFDIASLLSCLHQLRTENIRLEEHVNNLVTRRDHLLAVNARLAIPLNPNVAQAQGPFNNMHINGPSDVAAAAAAVTSRTSRSQSQHFNVQQTLENGIDFRHATSHQASNNTTSRLSSTSTFTTSTHSGNNRQQQTTVSVNLDQSRSRNTSNAFQIQQTSYIHQQPQNRSDDGQIKPI